MRNIRAGSDMLFEVKIVDISEGFPTPFNPDTATFRLMDSAGNISDVGILSSVDVGYWSTQHHVCPSAVSGYYSATVTVVSGGTTSRVHKFVPWRVTSGVTGGSFDYLRLISPNGHVWFLSVKVPTITPAEAILAVEISTALDDCFAGVPRSTVVPSYLVSVDSFLTVYYIGVSNIGVLTYTTVDPGAQQQLVSPQSGFTIKGHDQVVYQLPIQVLPTILRPVPYSYPSI